MATTTTQKEENIGQTIGQERQSIDNQKTGPGDHKLDPKDDDSVAPVLDGSGKDGDEAKSVGDSSGTGSQTANNDGDARVSDTQKKIRRAERFGVPVQLSEAEKRNSRAERFGTAGPAVPKSDSLKNSEEQKRKARAERFGLGQSVPADEEAKKKARLARFTGVSKTDPQEEDKKKARALRFSQPPSNSLSEAKGNGNIETKTAIAGKVGGGT